MSVGGVSHTHYTPTQFRQTSTDTGKTS